MNLSQAARDVISERDRQVDREGFRHERDDRYTQGELALAGACYAVSGATRPIESGKLLAAIQSIWPRNWSRSWWKPTTNRRDLVKAGALILAEIERLDRAEAREQIDKYE